MNAPDPDDSDEGEGSQRLSSTMSSRVGQQMKVGRRICRVLSPGGEDAMAASPYSIRARSRRQVQPCIRKEGGDVPAAAGESGGGGRCWRGSRARRRRERGRHDDVAKPELVDLFIPDWWAVQSQRARNEPCVAKTKLTDGR